MFGQRSAASSVKRLFRDCSCVENNSWLVIGAVAWLLTCFFKTCQKGRSICRRNQSVFSTTVARAELIGVETAHAKPLPASVVESGASWPACIPICVCIPILGPDACVKRYLPKHDKRTSTKRVAHPRNGTFRSSSDASGSMEERSEDPASGAIVS